MDYFFRIVVVLFAFFLVGCGKRETDVDIAVREKILLVGNGTEPKDIDPQIVTGLAETNVARAIYEGLVNPNAKTFMPEGGVAERWDISEDGKVYTFYLRTNARWSNGEPFTAEDFVKSYKRMLSPRLMTEYADMLFPIKNAKAYRDGSIKDFADVGVKAITPHTLEISLENPTARLLNMMLHPSWFPVYLPEIEANGDPESVGNHWTLVNDTIVTNGAFRLKAWKFWEVIEVEKNPYYWNVENVALNGVKFFPMENVYTEERAFRTGQLHITETLPPPKAQEYIKSKSPYLRSETYLGNYYYLINTTEKPFDDPRIRLALSLAIDRRQITESVMRGGQAPAYAFTPPNTAGYTSDAQLEESISHARELFAKAGFPDGKGFPTFTILYNTSDAHRTIAEAIQQMWRKNLNVNVELLNQDWKVYLDARNNQKYDVCRAGWIGDYNDPETFLGIFTSGNGNNHSGWKNEAFDRLIEQSQSAVLQNERYEKFQEAEKILLEESPLIPIYYYRSLYLLHPSVKGWYPNPMKWIPYKDIDLESENIDVTQSR